MFIKSFTFIFTHTILLMCKLKNAYSNTTAIDSSNKEAVIVRRDVRTCVRLVELYQVTYNKDSTIGREVIQQGKEILCMYMQLCKCIFHSIRMDAYTILITLCKLYLPSPAPPQQISMQEGDAEEGCFCQISFLHGYFLILWMCSALFPDQVGITKCR